ncbi:3-hydroxyacyl-ACP dehydratase FabZ family protein [Winogradskyella sp. UBA3174]|uniref:3-hydroxyacyl-ACP dehydratase FabZ family protein n=1 Tax=Winogradskyella sp. UBA3174 TaxID=1947785 RepID=UPI0025E3657C|nr:hydroxymyristoyl-ACP dehydratase [Winogradskyella sp. UBA3174]|tara:strand:+ start:1591 stop:2028 length:438 start_codon:yes stop_codon:yes gene_type:complete
MKTNQIIQLLPYQQPFLFVDGIDSISENEIMGHYTFKKEETFYEGHFKDNPITPGVILTECMAQIGLVCLGIYLLKDQISEATKPQIALTSHQMDFYLPVLPNEKVTVISEKQVFRFNKLKCKVKMLNEKGELVCRGVISGMLKV